MSNESILERNIRKFREFIEQRGWTIVSEGEIQSGYQFRVTDGQYKIPVNFYTTGKALIQGKAGGLHNEISNWWKNLSTHLSPSRVKKGNASITPAAEVQKITSTGLARIGIDESGKGDFFGPLVIGAVYVDGHTEETLIQMGVRDSKRLSDNRILKLAQEIKLLCPHSVVHIGPKRYNELYAQIGNLNKLLAWGHARALENVLVNVSCNLAVADQFGDKSFLHNALLKKGKQITLKQQPKAEEDTAVASGSILARADFVQSIKKLARRVGKSLPKGSSNPLIVTIGREIVKKGGQSSLAEVAKLHFKTTKLIIG